MYLQNTQAEGVKGAKAKTHLASDLGGSLHTLPHTLLHTLQHTLLHTLPGTKWERSTQGKLGGGVRHRGSN